MGDKESNKTLSVKLNEYFKDNIKLSFVSTYSVIIVTNDGKVYEFKRKSLKIYEYSVLLIGNNSDKIKTIIDNSMVEELCNKQVIHLKSGWSHVIASTSDGKVYCWGSNVCGQLGNGKSDYNTYIPELNQYLKEKQIIDICCGVSHTIVLTISGEVYSWGYNNWGQIGVVCNDEEDEKVSIPQQVVFQLRDREKVKAISCGSQHSLALTDGGRVFSWGSNLYKQLGVSSDIVLKKDEYLREYSNNPILIEMNGIFIKEISCGIFHSLLLSREKDIYVFGYNSYGQLGTGDKETQITPKKLNISNQKFSNISAHSHYCISVALSVNSLYYIWGQCGQEVITQPKQIKPTNRTNKYSFEEIFENYLKTNFKPIKNRIIEFDYCFVNNGKYENIFIQIEKLGEGVFGEVFKAQQSNSDKERFVAIKKIAFKKFNENAFLDQLQTSPIVCELRNKNIMEYYDIWLENDFTLENGNKVYSNNYILYIEMELCDKTLDYFIKEIKDDEQKKIDSNLYSTNGRILTELGYYISSEIFIQILKGVKFLHEQNPQIIDGDLSLFNIMLKIEENDISFVKIVDFGLARILQKLQTKDRGNMAPDADPSHTNDLTVTNADVRTHEKFISRDTTTEISRLKYVLEKLFIIYNRKYDPMDGNI